VVSKDKIERINFLARKSKAEGLTENEKNEQKKLREEYLRNLRTSVKNQLDGIEIID
jgi:uncharacterized protein YnzC (UPF0291/DUF896 family)